MAGADRAGERNLRSIPGGRSDEVARRPIPLIPEVGDEIYIRSQIYVNSGRSPDIIGGLTRITEVVYHDPHYFVTTDVDNTSYNWTFLRQEQPALEARFKNGMASRDWRGNPLFDGDDIPPWRSSQ